jgi:hypothetical protein
VGCNFAQGRCVQTGGGGEAGRLSEGQHPRTVKTGASIPTRTGNPGVGPAQRPPHRRHVPGGGPQRRPRPMRDRAALTAAIDMVATGKAEGLVCYSLDRLAREITVQEAILAKVWEEAGGRGSPPTRARSCATTPTTPCGPRCGRWLGSCTSWTGAWSWPGCAVAVGSRPSGAGMPAAGPLRVHHRTQAARARPDRAGRRSPHPSAAPGRPVNSQHHRPAQRRPDPSQTRRHLAPDHRRPGPPEDPVSPLLADRDPNGADRPSAGRVASTWRTANRQAMEEGWTRNCGEPPQRRRAAPSPEACWPAVTLSNENALSRFRAYRDPHPPPSGPQRAAHGRACHEDA